MNSTLKGFLFAPCVPAVLVIFFSVLQGRIYDGLWWAQIILPISYVSSVVLGLPLHFILVKTKLTHLICYIIAGALASVLPIALLLFFPFISTKTSQPLISLYPVMGSMTIAGIIISVTFWVVARPDFDSRNIAI